VLHESRRNSVSQQKRRGSAMNAITLTRNPQARAWIGANEPRTLADAGLLANAAHCGRSSLYRRLFAGGDGDGDYLTDTVICFTLFCRNGRYRYLRRDF
jgi:hypothetical protein